MGCADPRSAEINRREGVARTFHIVVYKIEPCEAVSARNLLTNDDVRAALRDEVVPEGPKVPLVVEPTAHAAKC